MDQTKYSLSCVFLSSVRDDCVHSWDWWRHTLQPFVVNNRSESSGSCCLGNVHHSLQHSLHHDPVHHNRSSSNSVVFVLGCLRDRLLGDWHSGHKWLCEEIRPIVNHCVHSGCAYSAFRDCDALVLVPHNDRHRLQFVGIWLHLLSF